MTNSATPHPSAAESGPLAGAGDAIDVFVIGAMKSATTTVCEWLDAQPGVVMSNPKEPSIYVTDDEASQWRGHVHELFEGEAPGMLRAEGSTDYAKYPAIDGVPERVRRHHPEARLVYLMREPVDRLVSQYRFDRVRGDARGSLDRTLETNPQLVDNGRYALQLEQWLAHFAPERFVLVFTEAFAADPAAQVRRILRHVGAPDPEQVAVPVAPRTNETALLRRRTWARRLFRQSRLGRRLRPLVPTAVTEAYRRRVADQSVPSLSEATRDRLVDVFDADLARLTLLTDGPGITCATWGEVVQTWTPELTAR